MVKNKKGAQKIKVLIPGKILINKTRPKILGVTGRVKGKGRRGEREERGGAAPSLSNSD